MRSVGGRQIQAIVPQRARKEKQLFQTANSRAFMDTSPIGDFCKVVAGRGGGGGGSTKELWGSCQLALNTHQNNKEKA